MNEKTLIELHPQHPPIKILTYSIYEDFHNQVEKNSLTLPLTENYLGDYDLLNQFDNILDTKIQKYGLTNLQAHKPLILCLDDFEIFWALSTEEKAVQDFEEYYRGWERSDKGSFLYNFSSFISSNNDAVIKNDKYLTFFDYSKFLKELGAE